LRFSKHGGFEFLERGSLLFHVRTGVDLQADAECVAVVSKNPIPLKTKVVGLSGPRGVKPPLRSEFRAT